MLFPESHLILFTRYPVPGSAKTRLIPALGAEGAAAVSREMTEHTLGQVQALTEQSWGNQVTDQPGRAAHSLRVEIRFAGGTERLMQDWLGHRWQYVPQGEGTLGDRLTRSLQAAFDQGATRTIIIGTDCPDLTADLLQTAFAQLTEQDLVLGPALDGGYYLIGMRRYLPELFQNIAWSTAAVLQQTIAIGHHLGLAIALLPTLSDVDYPEDLAIWQRVKPSTSR